MKNVLIVGAGRLGKGFIAETFDRAGWNICFLDKDPRVKEELDREGCFYVKVHRTDRIEKRKVSGFQTFVCDPEHSCMNAFLKTDVIMLPLYPEDFEEAGYYLAPCFDEFYKVHPDRKLTLVCITNKNRLIPQIESAFQEKLQEETKKWFKDHVVIRDSIIRRSTDAENNYALHIDTVAVNSLLIQGPVYNDFDDVEWMELCDKLEMLKDIKVTAVNGPHASLAFLGYLKGYQTIPEAEADEEIAEIVEKVEQEIISGIMREYPVTSEELHNLIYFAPAKGVMPDSIYRVGYDPIRKLAFGDRLTGAARTCQKYGVSFKHIAIAIAAGFGYAEPRDRNAQILQADIRKMGIEKAVCRYTGLAENDEITKEILTQYDRLKKKDWIC